MFGKHPQQFAQAKILADEGYGTAMNSGDVALQHQKYIVEVHPDDGPAFRTEVAAWVSWIEMPQVGDILRVKYRPGSTKVELVITGDPRYDWELRRAAKADSASSTREGLLNGRVSQLPIGYEWAGPASASASASASAAGSANQPESELFARIDELTKAHRAPQRNE